MDSMMMIMQTVRRCSGDGDAAGGLQHLGWLGTAHEVVHHVDCALHVGKLDEGLIAVSTHIELCFHERSEIP